MSDPRKLRPDEAWDAVQRMGLHDEAERVEALSPEARDRELRAMGRDPEAERAKVLALVARIKGQAPAVKGVPAEPAGTSTSTAKVAPVIPMTAPRPKSRTLLWLLAAALGVVAVVLLVERQEIAVWLDHAPRKPYDIEPDKDAPLKVAGDLRDEAASACDKGLWALCERKLDAAVKIDASGESSERVKGLRKVIADNIGPNLPKDDKRPPKGSAP
jgi:hypothetical protein